LLYLLLGMALIEADRRIVPWKLITLGIVAGIGLTPVHLLTVQGSLSPAMDASAAAGSGMVDRYGPGLLAAISGLLGGMAWGLLLARVGRPEGNRRRAAMRRAVPASMAMVGVILGWQAATSVAVAAIVLRGLGWLVAAAWPNWSRAPSSGYVLAATILHVVTWRWQEAIPFWPGRSIDLFVLVGVVAAGLLAAVLESSTGRERRVE
jgi:hypothetical protein